ncbi:MAG TPA: hypothetical protein PLU72_16880 [Candidatus Ozemobacteraceae bacterium]|nr:hypothetical protein [Candidatus Ozemobacteraceae bacterium]HQG27490.1 hypothetical protein [Candidatus Ozemobacteraceae bacterium]
MEKQIGVWVDHRKAVIVTIWEEKETVQIVRSSLETTGHPLGVASQYGGQDMQADDTLQRHSATYLKKFYADIASYVKNADSIMLMGPGEAKIELRKSLERRMMGDRIVDVMPADKLTEREVVLKVRAYYAKS